MMWLLPVLLLALTLVAIGVQRQAVTRYGEVACLRGRHGHSLSPHLAVRRSRDSFRRRLFGLSAGGVPRSGARVA
jgi:hypothetical protein